MYRAEQEAESTRGKQGGRDRSLKLLLPEISSMMEKRGLDLESSVAGVNLAAGLGPGYDTPLCPGPGTHRAGTR